jgi:hypothetical protein
LNVKAGGTYNYQCALKDNICELEVSEDIMKALEGVLFGAGSQHFVLCSFFHV